MKLRIILFGLIIASTFASCSSEGDILEEIANDQRPEETRSTLTLNLDNKVSEESDMAIHNFVVALFSNDTKITYQEATGSTARVTDLIAGFTVDIYVVANATNSDFEGINTKADFENKVTSLTQDTKKLIKVGVERNYTLKAGGNTINPFTVEQISARVDLAGITVNFKGGNSQFKFRLTGIELENVQNSTQLYSDDRADSFESKNLKYALDSNKEITHGTTLGKKNQQSTENSIATLYTFANKNQNKTTRLVIKGEILKDGKVYGTHAWPVEINPENAGTERGKLYEIYATLTGDVTHTEIAIAYEVSKWNSIVVDVPSFN